MHDANSNTIYITHANIYNMRWFIERVVSEG